jgi:hypothetical protein
VAALAIPVDDRPYPVSDPDSAPFWTATAQRRLVLPHCPDCSQLRYPPAPRCPDCLRPLTDWRELSGRASVHSWTEVHAGLVPGIPSPYMVLEVEPVEQPGLVMTSALVGDGRPAIGEPVELVWSEPYPDGTRLPCFRLPDAP